VLVSLYFQATVAVSRYPSLLPYREPSHHGQCVNDPRWGLSNRQRLWWILIHYICLSRNVWMISLYHYRHFVFAFLKASSEVQPSITNVPNSYVPCVCVDYKSPCFCVYHSFSNKHCSMSVHISRVLHSLLHCVVIDCVNKFLYKFLIVLSCSFQSLQVHWSSSSCCFISVCVVFC